MKSLSEIRQQYIKQLSEQYSLQEIDIIFYALAENYLHINKSILKLSLNELKDENDLKYILFLNALFQLKEGIPYQYVLGSTIFFGCEILVNKNVLIPRPETEELVEWILKDINNKNQKLQIIDLCSGSGCISIALAKNLPKSQIDGIDVSEKALELSQKNSVLNKVSVNYIQTNLLDSEKINTNKKYDIIVSNPPYIKKSEKRDMDERVYKFEPNEALFVTDENPLIFYKEIIKFSMMNLNEKGKIYIEINQNLSEETQELFLKYFTFVELKKDLSGNYRMIKAEAAIK
ncbi:peptide chain release factor N(5)-glutamine methyltransferase [Apibacter adventoris]|uniref:peptide chain release factor N(5)-glutamine methyltransferase n=1 Tax=Apibacter adventoris TaxID=1679466 RepID=A0A2S8AAY3_9FLAO|nr:peptide chain release factor N(5)-glutamine methyltransferase [Apibacter adventoris]PQL91756.1 peptide chain release factor N(5)-glutamine methyltransferase [Apibacter adventoris]